MWAAGMAGIRLPSMMPGLRMEEGTAASGGLETWTILEGLLGWSRAGAKARAARMETAFPSSAHGAEGGAGGWSAKEKTPP